MAGNDADGEMLTYLCLDADGLVVAACVDNPAHKKDTAKFLADGVKDGLTIARCKVKDLWEGRVKLYQPFAS